MLADYAAIAIQNMQLVRQIQVNKEREKQQIRGLFERYVAPSVVEQVINRPEQAGLGGTRKTLTILFADVRGFSEFSSKMSPEILLELLNYYMKVAADAVLAQEGTLDKFMGDAVMAFFNAPVPQSDHSVRAIRAAWSLKRAVKQLHRRLPPAYHLEFGIGVGIGDAVVGNIGTAQMMNYTALGDSVNKVKRLQENAEGGQILISQVMYHMVQEYVEAKPLGNIQLKGLSHPEFVYEVLNVDA
jgi:class 3 adenylate cyclase